MLAIYIGDGDNNTWTGTGDADTAYAQGGNDVISGLGGDDSLYGRDGNDELYGGADNDLLFGGNGDDLLDGGDGDDTLMVHSSEDTLGLSAGDRFVGGSGYDRLSFVDSNFTLFDIRSLFVAADIEYISAQRCTIRLTKAQFLQFQKYEGSFSVTGSGTFDLSGDKFVSGSLHLDSGDDIVTLAGNHPNVSAGSFGVFGGGGNDQIIATEASDILQGDSGNDRLEGGGGNDYLSGGGDDDTLLGGDGNDEMWGAGGVDSFDGGGGDDVVHLNFADGSFLGEAMSGGTGVDTISVIGSGSVDLGSGLIANDFERYTGAQTNVRASASQANNLQRFEALSLTLTTGGSITVTQNFKVREVILSDAATSVDFTQLTGFSAYATGGAGDDSLTGSQQLDVLLGGGGNDVIHGGGSNDELGGGAGLDWVDGGAGNDTITIAKGETITAGDRFTGGTGTDTLFIAGENHGDVVVITNLSDALLDSDLEVLDGDALVGARLSTAHANQFGKIHLQTVQLATSGSLDLLGKDVSIGQLSLSAAGNTVRLSEFGVGSVFGGAGDDIVYLSANAPPTHGGGGSDQLHGAGGDDTFYGEDGDDILNGLGGNDNLYGGAGNNVMSGGTGDDVFYVETFGDLTVEAAGEGFDRVYALASHTLGAGQEIEVLAAINPASTMSLTFVGNEFGQTISGNNGANVLNGGGGADVMAGFAGDDTYDVDNAGDIVMETAGNGFDAVYASVSYALAAGAEAEWLSTSFTAGTAALNLTGNGGFQYLIGNAGANRLDGGAGADVMIGFAGDDVYFVDNAADQAFEDGALGFDAILTSVSYALAAGQEIEWLSTAFTAGTAAINLAGNEIANYLIGNNGANTLNGGGGADAMTGFAGDDIYLVDTAGDAVTENAGEGFDAILTDVSYVLAAGVSLEWLSTSFTAGTAAINLTGNEIANFLVGNNGANTLNGGGGADIMTGFAGDDVYLVDTAGDLVNENAGEGFDAILANVSYAAAAGVSVEWLSTSFTAGTAAINLTGNEIANFLIGNNGANTLNGGGGADVMTGFAGDDSFAFTTALGAGNVDTIADFAAGTDKILLDDAVFTQIGAFGALNANAFVAGTAAADASDRIIYNSATGQLFYDADGTGAGAAVPFATLQGNPALAAGDFTVI
ncbi:MAG TPA: hypothetical protein VEC11_12320 [Allosphingosinicella sp.]|nr:hypothetical protein [Allosphingosinicella sp.]